MPIVVDEAHRRLAVVNAAAALIVEGGLPALSFRNLARQLGCSTTVVSHYFRDKQEVLAETFRHAAACTIAQRDRVLAATGGDLLRAMEALLPASEEQRRNWIVWLNFWNAALVDPALREEHRAGLAGTRDRLRDHIAARGHADPEDAAEVISSALVGISAQSVFDPEFWTPERQVAAFRRAVRQTLGDAPDAQSSGSSRPARTRSSFGRST
jgi:AcrR family transcriptional regulator